MKWCLLLLVALAATGDTPAPAQAPAATSPRPGMIFAQTVRAGTTILPGSPGAKTRPLTRGENFPASGQLLTVPADEALALILSNGDALYLPAGGRMTLDEFTQDPIFLTDHDRDYEPSRSTLRLNLALGTLAVSGRKPVPTSSLTLVTPLAQLTFHSQSLVVQVEANKLTVTLFDGTVDVKVPETGFHDTILGGQTSTLARPDLHATYPLKTSAITAENNDRLNGWLTAARTVENRLTFIGSGKNSTVYQRVPFSFPQQMSADDPRYH